MSEALLEAERPALLAIPSADVEAPDLPMSVALQEAHDLSTLLREAGVWERLAATGLPHALRDTLERSVAVARAAQSRWTIARDRTKSEAQSERESRGYALRSELVAAARWNLKDERTALGTLSVIAEGDGVPDLIQDLSDLAELIETKAQAFANDRTFALAEKVEQARSLASELSASTSAERLDVTQAEAVDLRNRAYTQLASVVSTIREGARYAFRNDPLRTRFPSRYETDKLRRARKVAAARATPSA